MLTSGYTCASLAGPGRTVADYVVVGGSGRYAGASGTARVESDFVSLSPAPGLSALTGTITGELSLP